MADEPDPSRALILPAGTQVVTRVEARESGGERVQPRGAVGVIAKSPADHTHAYRVRFPDGSEAALRRHEIDVRREVQREGLASAGGLTDIGSLERYVIYRCVVGSQAFGLAEEASDVDRRGIYLPPAELHWSLAGVPEQLDNDGTQEIYWELQKFVVLALKANPNVLECLYTPLVEQATSLARELLGMRSIFVSKLLYQTYNGYVLSQFKRFESVRRAQGRLKWKHVMHLIRLLVTGVTALREGYIPVRVEEHRERLLAIRRGELAWEEIDAWRLALHREFDAAYQATRLPDRPDYEQANTFLLKARRSMV